MLYNNIKRIYSFIAVCLIAFFAVGCGKLKGEFAFKSFGEDTYKRVGEVPEFEQSELINWVFIFKKLTDRHQIGVTLLKKELVWIDINTRSENITLTKKIIYGEIQNFEEGRYRILLSKEGAVVAEKEFIIFRDEDRAIR